MSWVMPPGMARRARSASAADFGWLARNVSWIVMVGQPLCGGRDAPPDGQSYREPGLTARVQAPRRSRHARARWAARGCRQRGAALVMRERTADVEPRD